MKSYVIYCPHRDKYWGKEGSDVVYVSLDQVEAYDNFSLYLYDSKVEADESITLMQEVRVYDDETQAICSIEEQELKLSKAVQKARVVLGEIDISLDGELAGTW